MIFQCQVNTLDHPFRGGRRRTLCGLCARKRRRWWMVRPQRSWWWGPNWSNLCKKNTLLRVIPTMTFIHFVTGKSSLAVMVVVEVRQGTLGGDTRGWGPAGNTGGDGRGWGPAGTLGVDGRGWGPTETTVRRGSRLSRRRRRGEEETRRREERRGGAGNWHKI